MTGVVLVMGLLLGGLPTQLKSVPESDLIDQAFDAQDAGRKAKGDPREAHVHFARSAACWEEIHRRGWTGPDLFRNLGNAYLLAGDLPRAILAYRQGLRLDPVNRPLRANLEVARAEVVYPPPGTLGRPPDASWPRWLPRPGLPLIWRLGIVAYGIFWLLLTRWIMVRHAWLLAAAAGMLALTVTLTTCLCLEMRSQANAAQYPVVVVARDGVVLRKGNGLSYPPRNPTPLNRGVEAQQLFTRGDWLQIRLAGGEVGWVPVAEVLVDTD